MKREKKYWVYDKETLKNCYIACFEDLLSDEKHVFVINRECNDFNKLIKFFEDNIKHNDKHFGFNCNNFDGQITEFLWSQRNILKNYNTEDLVKKIYDYSQTIIHLSNTRQYLDYKESKFTIKTVDIFKLNHWDSHAKSASLKWIQFTMDWENVEEMPHKHYDLVNDDETLDKIISYCVNDVKSTKAIFNQVDKTGEKLMYNQINLRAELTRKYPGLYLFSASEPKISKDVFLHFLSAKTGIDKYDLKERRTLRNEVIIKDILLPYIKFNTPEFKSVYNWFKDLVVDCKILDESEEEQKKKGPKYKIINKNVTTVYGLGGLHGSITPGVYKSDKNKIIKSVDVTSFYPMLAIKNKWSPKHIDTEIFCDLYQWFFDERKKYSKKDPLNYLFKIILNSTYGLSKSKYSFLYDPELTFKITVNGQMLLSMLYEMILQRIPNSQPLMQNTDGLEFIIDREYEKLFNQVCKEWMDLTSLSLEFINYDKIIIADVNNYIAVYEDKKIKPKCKGRFEFEDLPLHKNKSFLVVPKAIYEYFINGVKPKDYLEINKNIYDYCGGAKLKEPWEFCKHTVETGGVYTIERLQKMIRYYISNKGCKLIKRNKDDGREIQFQSGPSLQTIFNKFINKPWKDYDLNMKFYLNQINSEIEKIENNIPMSENSKSNQISLGL